MTNYSKLALVFDMICLMCAAIVSCEKDATSEQQKIASVPAISKEDAMTKFSMILIRTGYFKRRCYDKVFYDFVEIRITLAN